MAFRAEVAMVNSPSNLDGEIKEPDYGKRYDQATTGREKAQESRRKNDRCCA